MSDKIEMNWVALDGYLQYGATKIDAAELLGVSEDTIDRRIKERFGVTFSD